jgi:hypothetical protein
MDRDFDGVFDIKYGKGKWFDWKADKGWVPVEKEADAGNR